jgi:predicted ATPase/DNA-binding CsgD family transcriptional regulator
MLIGRSPHLDALVQLVEQACAGQGQVVLVTGEAGIGKSRLNAALKARLHAQAEPCAVQILEGRCFEPDTTVPFAPLLDVLRGFLASRPAGEGAAALIQTAPDLVTLLPELAGLLPSPVPGSPRDPQQEKRRLFQALTRFLIGLATDRPLLLLIEDVHWSDDTSLDFLLALARTLAAQPMLLLLTVRSEEVQPALARFLADVERERLATELPLTRLNRIEVGIMLHALFPQSRPLPEDFRETLFALTEGNPFFIEELLKALIMAGDLSYSHGTWNRRPLADLQIPRTIQVAVQRRVDQVSPEARDLLALLAVTGRRGDFALLQQLTSHDDRTLVRLVKELIAAQLVVEESADIIAFRHALTRQAIYSRLLARERKALHQAIAETMERLYAANSEAHLDELAYHSYQAGDWSRTFAFAQRAADRALALVAPRAALDHLSHALDAAHYLAMSAPISLYRARAQVAETLGEFDRARRDYEQVLQQAGQAADRRAVWQSLLDLGALWTARDYQQAGAYFQRAITEARELDDPATLAHTLNRVGNWYANLEHPLEALHYHQEARDLFETLNDQRGMAETLDFLGTSSLTAARLPEGLAYYRQAMPLLHVLEDRHRLVSALGMMTMRGVNYLSMTVAWQTTSHDECAQDAEAALALARQIGWRAGEAFALIFLGLGLGPRGTYAPAYQCAQASLEIATEIEHGLWMTFAHYLLGSLAHDLLAWPLARRHLEQAVEQGQASGSLFWRRITRAALAMTCLAQGDSAQAAALLRDETWTVDGAPTMAQRIIWCACAELELALRQPERALEIVDALITSLQIQPGVVIPRLWHLRAEALIALDRADEAGAVLQVACTVAQQQGAAALLWRIWVSIGRLAQAQAQRKVAVGAFSAARLIIEDLAAGIPDAQVQDTFLRAATLQLPPRAQPTPRQAARDRSGGLTERERDVAALVAQGQSNRGIATVLILSERTVEKHVERIMAKLGVSTRAQIAAWAVQTGVAAQ